MSHIYNKKNENKKWDNTKICIIEIKKLITSFNFNFFMQNIYLIKILNQNRKNIEIVKKIKKNLPFFIKKIILKV